MHNDSRIPSAHTDCNTVAGIGSPGLDKINELTKTLGETGWITSAEGYEGRNRPAAILNLYSEEGKWILAPPSKVGQKDAMGQNMNFLHDKIKILALVLARNRDGPRQCGTKCRNCLCVHHLSLESQGVCPRLLQAVGSSVALRCRMSSLSDLYQNTNHTLVLCTV